MTHYRTRRDILTTASFLAASMAANTVLAGQETVKANASADPAPTPGQMVDALHTAFGDHHVRAVHAKGIMVTGTFVPSAQASKLSKASLFKAKSAPVLLRFSDFTGIPDIPDTVGDSNPRGLALKFTHPDGSTTDIVSQSFNGFPMATSAEFRELLLAIPVSGPTAPKPTPLDRFLGSHPIAKTFLTTQKKPSVSYATLEYYGVNAFAFTAPGGKTVHVRYRFVPVTGEAFLTAEDLAKMGPNYLSEELPKRLAKGPVTYKWVAQIAETGDVIEDPSVAWPETRRLVELGTIRITGMAPDGAALDRSTMFNPLNVPDGIAAADPMLSLRKAAYPISFKHRQQPERN
jgi:catalase